MSDSLRPHELYNPWNSPSKITGVVSLSLLQGILQNQGSSPDLPYCRQILYQMSHKGSPRILVWVAYPLSSGSSQPRNWTGVSHIAGIFFTNGAIREALPINRRLKESPLSPKRGMAGYLLVASGIWHYNGCSLIKHPWKKHFWIRDSLQQLKAILSTQQLSLVKYLYGNLIIEFCISLLAN